MSEAYRLDNLLDTYKQICFERNIELVVFIRNSRRLKFLIRSGKRGLIFRASILFARRCFKQEILFLRRKTFIARLLNLVEYFINATALFLHVKGRRWRGSLLLLLISSSGGHSHLGVLVVRRLFR